MNVRDAAKEMVKQYGDISKDFKDVVASVTVLIDTICKSYAPYIIDCEDEAMFKDLLAAVADEAYEGDWLTEMFDMTVAKLAIELLDTKLLDKVLGQDWFDKFKEKAKGYLAGV